MTTSKRRRQETIVNEIARSGRVDVGTLATALGVSTMTVRRDMSELNERGLINRVHGGATSRKRPAIRATVMRDEKLAIARWVADSTEDGEFLGLDIGSTCTAVAHALNARGRVTVLSNSLESLYVLRSPEVTTIAIGGSVQPEGSILPHDPPGALEPYVLDRVILGCGGISASRGITFHAANETFFRRELLRGASEVILVADHTKFEREASFSLGGLSHIDKLVTTAEPEGPLADALAHAGVEVIVVPLG